MKIKSASLFFICCLFATKFYGQQRKDTVAISYDKNSTNDTVWLYVSTTAYTKPGTLMLIATSSLIEKTDTSFYPVIDTSSVITLALPPAYHSGTLQLRALFYPEIFEVTEQVHNGDAQRTNARPKRKTNF